MAALKEVKKGKNFVVYTDGQSECILLKNITFSYPHFGRAHSQTDNETGKTRLTWGGVAMLNKDTHEAAYNACEDLLKELLEKKEAKVARDKRCLKDGDSDEDGDIPAEYKNHWYISFSENADPNGKRAPVRPAVRDEFGKFMIDPNKAHDGEYLGRAINAIDTKFYGGCKGSVLIRPWYFNGKAANGQTYPKRLLSGYLGVQWLEDGKPFGNGRIDESAADWDKSDDDDGDGL